MRVKTFFETLNNLSESMFDKSLLVEIPFSVDKTAPLKITIKNTELNITVTLVIEKGEFDVAYQLPFSFDAEEVADFLKTFARFLQHLQVKYYETTGNIFVEKSLSKIYPNLQSSLNDITEKQGIGYRIFMKDNKIHVYRTDKRFVGAVLHNPRGYPQDIVVTLLYNIIRLDQS